MEIQNHGLCSQLCFGNHRTHMDHFSNWLSTMARSIARATVSAPVNTKQTKNEQKGPLKSILHSSKNETKVNKMECYQCQGEHYLYTCEHYLKAEIPEKWKMIKDLRLCFGCLRRGHTLQACKYKRECKKNGCKKNQHTSLHSEDPQKEEKVEPKEATINTIKPATPQLLFKVLAVEMLGPNNKIIQTYAFLDEGSSASLINEKLADSLGVLEPKRKLTLNWIENHAKEFLSMECNLRIRAYGADKKWMRIVGNSVPTLDLPLQSVDVDKLTEKYALLRNLPINGFTNAEPMMLIGINNCHLIANIKSVYLDTNLIAAKTPLGWLIYGSADDQKKGSPRVSVVLHACSKKDSNEQEIHDMIADYFTTENFGVKIPIKPLESAGISRARDILKNTSRKLNGCYETGLLWKEDVFKFPDSYKMALQRLQGIENKMAEYDNAIMDFINKGYAVKMWDQEAALVGPRTWYLPHFGVININKPKRMRLVFDAAATINGISLNTMLLKGPDENPPLTTILFKFRQGKIAVCADIKEMFLQVQVRKEDQDSLRFLWRHGNRDAQVDTYKMIVLIFGAACSPSCAQYIKNINAENAEIYREQVIDAIQTKHYVDDFVASFESEDDALQISREVKRVHKLGKFELRGFVSNSKIIQQSLNNTEENELVAPTVQLDSDTTDKILGMCWDSRSDKFVFDLKLNRVDKEIVKGLKCPTKRQLLSLVMSVYDPFAKDGHIRLAEVETSSGILKRPVSKLAVLDVLGKTP
ncbi:uncharacterized protein [Drosophila takahashii]|uniref:uncharacterized protein n=1 Tax=Drosophila takahashii TaxID=29030 RepID=UPI0038996E18